MFVIKVKLAQDDWALNTDQQVRSNEIVSHN